MIDKDQIKSALLMAKLLEHYQVKKTSNNQYWCPIHEQGGTATGHKSPSLALHPDSQTVTCMSQGCFEGDDIFSVIAKMEKLDIKQHFVLAMEKAAAIAGIPVTKPKSKFQPDFTLNGVTALTTAHREYLHKRGLNDETIALADFRSQYDKIVFLNKNNTNGIVGYKAKTIHPKDQHKALKNENPEWLPQFFHGSKSDVWALNLLTGKQIIYLAAGEYDLATIEQEIKARGLSAQVGAFTLTTGEKTALKDDLIKLLAQLSDVEFRIIYDFDQAGLEAMPKRAQELLKTGKKVFTFNWHKNFNPTGKEGFDVNDYYQEHGNLEPFFEESNFTENIAGAEEIQIVNYKLIHPSVEMMEDLALFGFRVLLKAEKKDDKDKYDNVFVVASNGKIQLTRSINLQTSEHEYKIDLRTRLLEPLQQRWDFLTIKEFVKNPVLDFDIFPGIENLIKKYIELPDTCDYPLLSAWVVGTYLYRTFWSYPFIHLKAPKQSGKSQFFDVLSKLSFNAKKARATFAALVDTVDSLRGTYIIDQADSLRNPNKEEILEILTDSYKTEGGKRRMIDMTSRERQVIESETYSPKAFASIKELPEDLRDRFYIIPMVKSSKNYPMPDEQSEDWQLLRGNLYKFALLKHKEAKKIYNDLLEKYKLDSVIVGRKAELWVPLESILSLCGCPAEQINKCKLLFLERYGFTQYIPGETEIALMQAIRCQFKEDKATARVTTKDIAAATVFAEIEPEEKKKLPQKAGWLIKKFNLTSQMPKRWGSGMIYTLDRQKVEKIYEAYFQGIETSTEPTPTPTAEQIQSAVDIFGGEEVHQSEIKV